MRQKSAYLSHVPFGFRAALTGSLAVRRADFVPFRINQG
jgi:hypothetical protein